MKIFTILRKDLLTLVRNRAEMAVLFLMPLAFILPISYALGAGDGYGVTRDNRMIPLPVANYDGGPRAQDLLAAVGESLLLETNFEAARLEALGLAGEDACGSAFGILPEVEATQVTASPGLAATGSVTPEEIGSPAPTEAPVETGTAPAPEESPSPSGEATGYPAAPAAAAVQTDVAGTGAPIETATGEPVETAGPTGAPGTTPTGPAGEVENGAASVQSSPACNELAARALLQRSARAAALVIPAGFSDMVDGEEPVQVSLVYDPLGDPGQLQQIEGVVEGAAIRVSLNNQVGRGLNQLDDLVALAPGEVRQAWQAQSAQPPAEEQEPALSLVKVFPQNYQFFNTPDTYQQTVPGYAVMYVFFIVSAMAGSFRAEKHYGTFRRLLSAPIGRAELAAGKLLTGMIVGFAQVIFLFLVGAILFKLGLGRDPLAFLVLTGALVTAAATLGLAAATTPLRGAGLVSPLIVAALLGGCLFPTSLMPPFLRSLSYLVPHSWALEGYLNLMVRGLGLQEIAPQVGALLGFALVFFLIAAWRIRFDG
jgi:ABC-2 type transport system permease protein